MMKSPCQSCPRGHDPDFCERKGCKLWSTWFLKEWAKLRVIFGVARDEVEDDSY